MIYLGLLGVTTLAAGLLLGLHGLKRRYAVAYHPAGRHGLAYKPGRAVTRGTSAAALGFTRPATGSRGLPRRASQARTVIQGTVEREAIER